MNWYVIHTYTGYEQKVKEAIEHLANVYNWQKKIGRIIIPMERVIKERATKPSAQPRNLMPGYVFVELEPEEELFSRIQSLPGVSAFLGAGGKPETLSPDDVSALLELVEERAEKPKKLIKFRPGEHVKVTEGPFANFVGVINEVDEEKARLRVLVTIFGRETPLELECSQVEAI